MKRNRRVVKHENCHADQGYQQEQNRDLAALSHLSLLLGQRFLPLFEAFHGDFESRVIGKELFTELTNRKGLCIRDRISLLRLHLLLQAFYLACVVPFFFEGHQREILYLHAMV